MKIFFGHLFIITVLGFCEGRLLWDESFDTLDTKRWTHQVTASRGGNNEFQYYRNNRINSFVSNGVLNIKATPVSQEKSDSEIRYGFLVEPDCNVDPCVSISDASHGETILPVYSARIETRTSFAIRYGRVVVRAKLPAGDWLVPAVFLLPLEDYYGEWPRSGEITVLEGRGNKDLRNIHSGSSIGTDRVAFMLHWGPSAENNAYERTFYTKYSENGRDFSDEFHDYELEWNEDYIAFKMDGVLVGLHYVTNGGFWELGEFEGWNLWSTGSKMAPFDRPFYIVIELAVGGYFFPDDLISNGEVHPWNWDDNHPLRDFYEAQSKWFPTWKKSLQIDYIHVYDN